MTKKINESIRVKYMTKVTLRFLKEKGYFGTIINLDKKKRTTTINDSK